MIKVRLNCTLEIGYISDGTDDDATIKEVKEYAIQAAKNRLSAYERAFTIIGEPEIIKVTMVDDSLDFEE